VLTGSGVCRGSVVRGHVTTGVRSNTRLVSRKGRALRGVEHEKKGSRDCSDREQQGKKGKRQFLASPSGEEKKVVGLRLLCSSTQTKWKKREPIVLLLPSAAKKERKSLKIKKKKKERANRGGPRRRYVRCQEECALIVLTLGSRFRFPAKGRGERWLSASS